MNAFSSWHDFSLFSFMEYQAMHWTSWSSVLTCITSDLEIDILNALPYFFSGKLLYTEGNPSKMRFSWVKIFQKHCFIKCF